MKVINYKEVLPVTTDKIFTFVCLVPPKASEL
jgi:hypothetical protein